MNMFRKPATLMHPFRKRVPFANTRGSIVIDYPACIHCGICARKCPADAIMVAKEPKSWRIEHRSCVICGACVDACPKKCLFMGSAYRAPVSSDNKNITLEIHESA